MSFTDSDPVEAGPLVLMGLWLHDPVDPQGTVRQFLYGRASRSTQINTFGTEQRYAGREAPVVEYGEHTDRTYSVVVNVPQGPDHQQQVAVLTEFAESKRTLVLRDNRGRAMFGRLHGFVVHDAGWGSAVQFTFSQVDADPGGF